ncbi:MAG: MFS transporter [Candidatus Latescibacterota bacterium]
MQYTRRILFSLMFPATLMPMVSTMSRVALPVIRDEFQISADMTSWVAVAFGVPFMILMPVYGRLSDGIDKRGLMLAGIGIFAVGTGLTVSAQDLIWLMLGRAIQGFGLAGIMPLSLAVISELFPAEGRGKSIGTWSSVGPTVGFIGPLWAGFLVSAWGWVGAFWPPLIVGVIAFGAVFWGLPKQKEKKPVRFWRTFDWVGVVLVALILTSVTFFISSRLITGVASLHDWRLFVAIVVFIGLFIWWEKRTDNPFVLLHMFHNRVFCQATFCASIRMVVMGGLTFLIPLYLVDLHHLGAEVLGLMLMVNSGAMALVVRVGGGLADRWTSRPPAVIGLSVQCVVMLLFSQFSSTTGLWVIVLTLALHGLGVGVMLAALHRAVIASVPKDEVGGATGLYSMFRFVGATIGMALSGVILQQNLDASMTTVTAYQNTFLVFAAFPVLGVLVGVRLREDK